MPFSKMLHLCLQNSGGILPLDDSECTSRVFKRVHGLERDSERQELQLFVGLASSISHTHEFISDQLAIFVSRCFSE